MYNQSIRDSYVSTCLKNIEAYEVDAPEVFRSHGFVMEQPPVEEPSKATVVGEAIVTFTGNLSAENRSDAQNAFLFATLVANKKYPLQHQGKENYEMFREVMTSCGWTPVTKFYSDLNVSGTSVRMDKLVLEILGSVVAGVALPGPTSALMLKVAGDAISALQKRDTALTTYERNLLENGIGGVAAGACTEVNGEAIMAVGAVRFMRRNSSTKVLFVDVDIRDAKLYRGETMFAKNDLVANEARDAIKKKLGLNISKKIEDYDI